MASGIWGDFRMLRQDRSVLGTGWMLKKIREADAVVALNQQIFEETVELGVAKEKIFHIPNGVEMKSDGHNRSYALGDPFVITFVGRLHPQKNVGMLLLAFKLLLQEKPHLPLRLKLAGTGPSERRLKALADELSISQQVEFLGHVNDVGDLLERSDLFVLPSISEGISNALLEAMAHGLPCVVTNIPGNSEVIQDGRNGIVIQPEDAAGLARALAGMADDEEFRRKVGRQARLTVETCYSLTKVTNQYIRLYERLLQQ